MQRPERPPADTGATARKSRSDSPQRPERPPADTGVKQRKDYKIRSVAPALFQHLLGTTSWACRAQSIIKLLCRCSATETLCHNPLGGGALLKASRRHSSNQGRSLDTAWVTVVPLRSCGGTHGRCPVALAELVPCALHEVRWPSAMHGVCLGFHNAVCGPPPRSCHRALVHTARQRSPTQDAATLPS